VERKKRVVTFTFNPNLMRHIIIYLLGACFLLFFFGAKTAYGNDSLIIDDKTYPAVERLRVYDDMCWEYMSSDYKKSIWYARRGVNLAKQEGSEKMTATLYRNLGVAYYMGSMHDSAAYYLDSALYYSEKITDLNLIALTNFAIANMYNMKGEYPEALKYYLEVLPYFESTGNKTRVRILVGNVGELYNALQNDEMAEKYLNMELELARELNDKEGIAHSCNGFYRIYLARNEFAKALKYAKEGAKLYSELGNDLFRAISIQSVAQAYYTGYRDFDLARKYALEALEITRKMQFPGNIAGSLNMLSNIEFHSGNYELSRSYALEALEIDSSDMNINSNLYANIIRAGISLGDHKSQTLEYLDIYRRVVDERAVAQFQQSMSELEVKYETDKSRQQVLILNKEKRLMKWYFFTGIAFLLMVVLILFLWLLNLNNQKKLAAEKLKNAEQQNLLIATQAVLDGETNERSRIARDLHDSLGGMLAVVKLNLHDVRKMALLEEEDMKHFGNALDMLDKSIAELRRVAHHMMPESLLRYGLKVAVADFCSSIQMVSFHFYGVEERFESKLEILLYRSVHELVHNALKHADCTEINVQMVQEADRLSLTVHDNGKGFDVELGCKGMGLQNIKQRVSVFKGSFTVYSKPGEGTEANIEISLNPIKND
jgi:two-component system, NarL family, sensor kinase